MTHEHASISFLNSGRTLRRFTSSIFAPARNSALVILVSEFRAIANSSALKLCCTHNSCPDGNHQSLKHTYRKVTKEDSNPAAPDAPCRAHSHQYPFVEVTIAPSVAALQIQQHAMRSTGRCETAYLSCCVRKRNVIGCHFGENVSYQTLVEPSWMI